MNQSLPSWNQVREWLSDLDPLGAASEPPGQRALSLRDEAWTLDPTVPTSHRLEVFRDDGSCECVELETRSLLLHDLVHYAIEAQAEIRTGFYGLLASGTTLAALGDRDNPLPTPDSQWPRPW